MSEVEIQARDGGTFKAYIAMPAVTPAPAIIMIQEIFGINKEMRDKCDALADQGYIAICPDLFWRIEPGIELTDQIEEELKRAFELFGAFDQNKGMEDLKATLAFMRNHDACNGKIGCMGYCLGGKLAYEMAAETDINASVSYYGVGLGAMLDKADSFSHPVLIHIAGDDEFTPKDEQEKIIEAKHNASADVSTLEAQLLTLHEKLLSEEEEKKRVLRDLELTRQQEQGLKRSLDAKRQALETLFRQ